MIKIIYPRGDVKPRDTELHSFLGIERMDANLVSLPQRLSDFAENVLTSQHAKIKNETSSVTPFKNSEMEAKK